MCKTRRAAQESNKAWSQPFSIAWSPCNTRISIMAQHEELFDEFHDIAIRDHVGGEHLRRMCLEHSEQIAMLREEVAQSEKEGKRKNEE